MAMAATLAKTGPWGIILYEFDPIAMPTQASGLGLVFNLNRPPPPVTPLFDRKGTAVHISAR